MNVTADADRPQHTHASLHGVAVGLFMLSIATGAAAATISFPLPGGIDSVFGSVTTVTAVQEETLPDIARRYSLGYYDIKLANPGVDTWLPGVGAEIVLPTEFVLPQAARKGIVINIPEMRLYYFTGSRKKGAIEVQTYPIGIGREGRHTPYVTTHIAQKQVRPTWFPPESIRKEHAAEGDPLPERVGPGPDNPLGEYAMRLGLPTYLIHGTNRPWGVGMRVSSGCIRLYPEDIATLYPRVKVGTPVRIVNQPYKVGLRGERLFLEAHPYLDEDAQAFKENLTPVVKMVVASTEERAYEIDWMLARQVIQDAQGVPVEIGRLKPAPVSVAGSETRSARSIRAATAADALNLRLETGLHSATD
jgi:L,D-transpeptidase ErfK/SrfK